VPYEVTTMANSFKDKVEDAGHKVAKTETKAGHKVGEKVEEATDWAKEKAHQAGHCLGSRS
jgi:thymidylate kinase